MKTKNLLVIILLIGLSFNAFSQEEVTIKQVIKNSEKTSNEVSNINAIQINTDCPIIIKSGAENVVYLTGDIDNPNSYGGFCTLKDGILKINSPSKDGKKFKITIELKKEVNLVCLGENTNANIDNGILSENKVDINLLKNSKATFNGNVRIGDVTFLAFENSKITFNGIIELGYANIIAGENSKIKFWNIDANYAKIVAGKGALVDLKGNIDTVDMKMQKEANINDNFTWTYQTAFRIDSSYFSNVSKKFKRINEDGTIITSNEDSIYLNDEYRTNVNALKYTAGTFANMEEERKLNNKEDTSSLVLKELSDAFAEVSDNLKKEGSNEVTKPIADAFQSAADNLKNKDVKASHKEKKKESKTDFGFQLGYGILNWSNRVGGIDNLFSSPGQEYSLRCSSSWNLGFRYEFKLNRILTISTGLGYESNIFRFDNNVKLNEINGERRIGFETDSKIDAESKLVARYVTIPLFIKYRVVKNFTLHVGAIAGVNFRTSSTGFKRNYDIPHAEVEERWGTKYDNFKPLKLDVQAGFGWGITNFYLKYAVTPLFKDNKEIEVYPFSVGVSFGL